MSNGEEQQASEKPQKPDTSAEVNTEAPTGAPEQTAAGKPIPDRLLEQALKVITDPVGFYRSMSKSGGFIDPLIFMVAMAIVSGVLSAVLSIFGIGMGGALAVGLMAIILIPIFVVIFGFVGAAIAFVIWKLMGSDEDYETAYRCIAYTAATGPVVTVLGIIPYLGTLVSVLWPMALLAIASIHVHRRSTALSWGVFGALGVLFALVNVSAERSANEMADSLEDLQRMMEEQIPDPD